MHENLGVVGDHAYVCSVAIVLILGIDSWIGVVKEYCGVEGEVEDRGRKRSSTLAGRSRRKIRSAAR